MSMVFFSLCAGFDPLWPLSKVHMIKINLFSKYVPKTTSVETNYRK